MKKFPHGTLNGYSNLGCRCTEYRAENAKYYYSKREMRKAERIMVGGRLIHPRVQKHGTENGYGNYGCRCRPCTRVWSDASMDRARRREERKKRPRRLVAA